MLAEMFDELLIKIGNPALRHPVFSNSPFALRFALGGGEPVYLDRPSSGEDIVNPEYIDDALRRAKGIYSALPKAPDLLRIDLWPQEEGQENDGGRALLLLQDLCAFPHERRLKEEKEDGEQFTVLQLYWDLRRIDFSPDLLLKEIIKADLGGIQELTSSVFFANTEQAYLYHVYDDRGADLTAACKETLYPVYYSFKQWILEHDRAKIEKIFAK